MKRSDRKKRSFKQGAGIAVIGEGPTEQYYLLSIQGLLPVNVYPKVVKDGMDYLIARVEECIAEGYDKIYCLIDMDNKSGQKEKSAYANFLRQYSGKQLSKGGSIEAAMRNSILSMAHHVDNPNGAFSEMCRLLESTDSHEPQ